MHCRKNQAKLKPAEKALFVAAVLALKKNGKYDQYVREHMNFMSGAHQGPAFFPWHREFLRRFELDLRAIHPTVTLPYWNWTVDNSPSSSIWGVDFMGGDGRPSDGRVTTGPFAFSAGNWPLSVDGPALRRRFGAAASSLPTPSDLSAVLADPVYDVSLWDRFSSPGFRNRLEGWISGPQMHNRVHEWVGGSSRPASSPNDPVFFLNHCFVDKLWAEWQAMHPGASYLPSSGAASGHNLGDAMQPWASLGQIVTPASVLDHNSLGYAYDNEWECKRIRDDILTSPRADAIKPISDTATNKFRDDILTSPRQDLFKRAVADKPPILDAPKAPVRDFRDPFGRMQQINPAPFVLSTPHHSMAWAASQGQTEVAQIEATLTQLERQLQDLNLRAQAGQLSEAELVEAEQLHQQYLALAQELGRLLQGGCG